MTEFSYLLAFESLLYGLLISKFLDTWNTVISNRDKNKFFWPHTVLSFTILLYIVSRFKNRFYSSDFACLGTGWEVVFDILIPLSILYFVLGQLFPSKLSGVDFRQHLKSNRIFHLGLPIFFLHGTIDIYLSPEYPFPYYGALIFAILWFVPFLRYNETYFKILVIITMLVTFQQLTN